MVIPAYILVVVCSEILWETRTLCCCEVTARLQYTECGVVEEDKEPWSGSLMRLMEAIEMEGGWYLDSFHVWMSSTTLGKR